MAIIWPCPLSLSRYAELGKRIEVGIHRCPGCGQVLMKWGGYWRWLRSEADRAQRIWIPRRRCPGCGQTQAVLPALLFLRRVDPCQVIGSALEQSAQGQGHRKMVAQLGRPASTVRDWVRRARRTASVQIGALSRFAVEVEGSALGLGGAGIAAVVEALQLVWERVQKRLRERTPGRWELWSLISGGAALVANTSPP